MNRNIPFLDLNCEAETDKITTGIQRIMSGQLKKRGLVVGLSGGVDSSVTVALCQKALGRERVAAILMPEQHSADDTLELSRMAADHFGVSIIVEDITGILTALGFYEKYNAAIQSVIPEYGTGWRSKIITSSVFENKGFTIFSVVAQPPEGPPIKKRLDLKAYLGIVAATNFKQRTRKMIEYYHADRLNYAVAGTPNRLEYDQGFFVKNGDGAADIKPIAHLYKTQVYQLGAYLGVPEEILQRSPTTDTYSLPQQQDEFYFTLPYDQMDACLYGKNNLMPPETIGRIIGLTAEQVAGVYKNIDQKRATTRYLHLPGQLIETVPEMDI
ncbi:MAG: NAD(+) synthase [Desulfobacteraceae bacterium]|nr:MAG: NAD(+) synthase [Desulfobacteraceae bacterium]